MDNLYRCPDCGALNTGPFSCSGATTERGQDDDGNAVYRAVADQNRAHPNRLVTGDDAKVDEATLDEIEGRSEEDRSADDERVAQERARAQELDDLRAENERLRAAQSGGAGDTREAPSGGPPPAPAPPPQG